MKGEAEDKETKFEGAYVKDPIVGAHDWVVSFDLDSLYPHLIMQYNLSPETKTSAGTRNKFSVNDFLAGAGASAGARDYLDNMRAKNLSVAGNCVAFRKDIQGFLPKLMETMYEERKAFKKKMLEAKVALKKLVNPTPEQEAQLKLDITKFHNFQLVRKIQLNSAFGACGNQYFRYYDQEIAEAITISGQVSIRWIENGLNGFLNKTLKTAGVDYVIASDTDSVYLRLGSLVKQVLPKETDPQKITKFLNKFCNEVLQPFIDKQYAALAEQQNAYAQKMRMKREGISSKGIWTAKKRYMLLVHDSEGVRYAKPKTKIMGIETTRSSTPQIIREELKKCIDIILTKDNDTLIKHIDDFRNKFQKFEPEDIAFPRSVNGVKDYTDQVTIYKKGTPIAVKGALLFNHYVKKAKLEKKYQLIRDADKIKFLYLKSPNPVGGITGKDCVISFMNSLPKEFDLKAYIDYDTQFEKAFLDPLKAIVEAIGWQTERRNTLESLFA
jgi:DNA polymerase elongation subunit (family B)